jgi:carbon monoxide dehydrogenase subunit G
MMVQFEGEKPFSLPPRELWPKLSDLQFLVQCLPDVAEVRDVGDKTATLVVRPGLSFMRGELQLVMEKTEETPPTSAKLALRTKGIGSNSEVVAAIQLVDQSGGTLVRWQAEITQLGGLLKMVPKGLIQGAAQQIIQDVMNNVEAKLASA